MMTFLIAAVIGLRPLAGDNTCAVAVRSGSSARELTVQAMRCSAMPVNIRWPGHRCELDQTEICHFARFDFRGETQVRVTVPDGTREVVVRPDSSIRTVASAITSAPANIRFRPTIGIATWISRIAMAGENNVMGDPREA